MSTLPTPTPNPVVEIHEPSRSVDDTPRNPEARPASSGEGDPFRLRDTPPRHGSLNFAEARGPYSDRNPRMSPSSMDKPFDFDPQSGMPELGRNGGVGTNQPLPPLPSAARGMRRQFTTETRVSLGKQSMIDHVVPVEEKRMMARTVGERLQPTLAVAMEERDKYARKARMTGYALNAAIGLQVLLGSLTTGLSAVATSGRSAAVQTTILGGLSTMVASYLARSRGSNEPELSITRTKDLEQFIRECDAFKMDHGHVVGDEFDRELENFRRRFEELLGNANGERRLAPPLP